MNLSQCSWARWVVGEHAGVIEERLDDEHPSSEAWTPDSAVSTYWARRWDGSGEERRWDAFGDAVAWLQGAAVDA